MTRAEWLNSRDGVFFLLDGPTTPYHMAVLAIIEGPPPGAGELGEAVERRLDGIPRFRQRLVRPLLLNRPAWVDDPRFEIGDHIRHLSARHPGSERELLEAVAVVMEQRLDPRRPLWELWLLDQLAGGRWAVVLKAHHALVDGITGIRDLALLLDPGPRARRRRGPTWQPDPVPTGARLLVDGLADRFAAPIRVLRSGWRAARRPGRTAEVAGGLALGLGEVLIEGIRPVSRSPINGRIGPNRRVELVRVPLQDLKDVKNALGGTINDVILAVAAGGLRRMIRSRGSETKGVRLRALVPVSLRPSDDMKAEGNLVAGVVAPLPVDEPNPVRRLEQVSTGMASAKGSHQILATSVSLGLPAMLPPRLGRVVARVQQVQRFFNLSVTNIPGPSDPLYLCGRRILDLAPLPPLSANCGLIIGAMSYAGSLTFGLVADPGVVPDLDLLAEEIEKSILELVHAAEGSS